MKITLCMIVHPEDMALAERAIASCAGLYDEKLIATPSGTRIHFGRQRNEVVLEASRDFDTKAVLWIDADQVIASSDANLRQTIERQLEGERVVWAREIHPLSKNSYRPLAYLLDREIRWIYPRHEILNSPPVVLPEDPVVELDSRDATGFRSRNREKALEDDLATMRDYCYCKGYADPYLMQKIGESEAYLWRLKNGAAKPKS